MHRFLKCPDMHYDDSVISVEQEIPNKDRVRKDEEGWGNSQLYHNTRRIMALNKLQQIPSGLHQTVQLFAGFVYSMEIYKFMHFSKPPSSLVV